MYVCMCVCMHACMHVCVCVYILYVYVCTHACMIDVCVCVCVYLHECIAHVHLFVCVSSVFCFCSQKKKGCKLRQSSFRAHVVHLTVDPSLPTPLSTWALFASLSYPTLAMSMKTLTNMMTRSDRADETLPILKNLTSSCLPFALDHLPPSIPSLPISFSPSLAFRSRSAAMELLLSLGLRARPDDPALPGRPPRSRLPSGLIPCQIGGSKRAWYIANAPPRVGRGPFNPGTRFSKIHPWAGRQIFFGRGIQDGHRRGGPQLVACRRGG